MGLEQVIMHYNDLVKVLKAKNKGYAAHSDDDWINFRELEPIVPAHLAALSRAGDKWNRIKSLISNPLNNETAESLTDSIDDMINYLAIFRDLVFNEDEDSGES